MVRNIWAVGRNYQEHAKELGNSVPKTPMIFLKAGSSVVETGESFELPSISQDIHHELELAVEFGPTLEIQRACVALDLTARDIQAQLKDQRFPWTLAKSFKNSCPVGAFFSVKSESDLSKIKLEFLINGELKQEGHTKDMVFDVPTLAKYVKENFPVCAGDLLLTGTPKGVGQIKTGDRLHATAKLNGGVVSIGQWQVK